MKLQDSHLSCLLLERTSINNCWILLRDKERSFKKNPKKNQNDYSCRQIWFKKTNKTIPKIIPDSGVKKEKIIRVYTLSKCPDFMCLNVSLKWIYCNDVQTISTHTHTHTTITLVELCSATWCISLSVVWPIVSTTQTTEHRSYTECTEISFLFKHHLLNYCSAAKQIHNCCE